MKKTASIVGMSLALARGFTGRHVVKVGSRQSMMTRSRRVAAAMTSSSVALTPLPTFEITSTKSGAAAWEGNMLVLPLFSPAEEADGDKAADAGDRVADLPAAYQALDEASFDGALSELVTSESFKANAGETVCVRLASGSSVRTLCVLGLGPQPADSTKEVDSTKFGEALAAVAKDRKPDRMGVVVPDAPCDASKIVGGMMTALYSEDRFKTGTCAYICCPAADSGLQHPAVNPRVPSTHEERKKRMPRDLKAPRGSTRDLALPFLARKCCCQWAPLQIVFNLIVVRRTGGMDERAGSDLLLEHLQLKH